MQYEQPIPFYMAYPFLLPLDQEQAQEKDLQVMRSFYSRRAAKIQEKVDRECDRMEYDGSMMFDEEVLKEEEGNTPAIIIEETYQGGSGACGNRREEEGLRDLIGVILFNEMFRRRSRHRRRKRFY